MISKKIVNKTIYVLSQKSFGPKSLLIKGVKQTARLWQEADGNEEAFIQFCTKHYIFDIQKKKEIFFRISEYLEIIQGHFNAVSLGLKRHLHEDTGPLLQIDEWFASYNPEIHLQEDLYANKIAFITTLNFPEQTLEEKEKYWKDRLSMAYARLGDIFTDRIPPSIQQTVETVNTEADVYISEYKIHAEHLLTDGKHLFPKNKILISHWGLRDEIKANYNQGVNGFNRQLTLNAVIKRIVSQEIPTETIHSDYYQWDPFNNTLYQDGKKQQKTIEKIVRYEKLVCQFKAIQDIDQLTGKTYIHRYFLKEMEISAEETKSLFVQYLSSNELLKIGQIIERRLGRNLEAFDIWYDGFKSRNQVQETELSRHTCRLYPDAKSFEKHIPTLLKKLGFHAKQASALSEKMIVKAARGSGHAWGATMKEQKSQLRTPIHLEGMDYEGYNTAIHELGHTVEQTISLNNVDYYMLNGVPNIAFSEALAFIFQKRDIELLEISTFTVDFTVEEQWKTLDNAWTLYEITGVSLLDISVWEWLYKHPNTTAEQLKEAVLCLSKTIWNKYFAPVFKIKDQTILAIYSHMISYPLYLPAYSYGLIIGFQLEQHLCGKNFAKEIERIFSLGNLTPTQWMKEATGCSLSIVPLLESIRKVLNMNE